MKFLLFGGWEKLSGLHTADRKYDTFIYLVFRVRTVQEKDFQEIPEKNIIEQRSDVLL